jgi:hypothetical protein
MAEELDLENRQLCPDGACIGVIGPDGRCRECGKKGEGPVAARAATATDTDTEPDTEPAPETDSPFDEDRQLCPDGACIGVIGPDGRCKECGKLASS